MTKTHVALNIASVARDGFDESATALGAALGQSSSARELVLETFPDVFERCDCDGLQLGFDAGDILFRFRGHIPALGTGELAIRLEPSQRYLELVTAIAAHLKLDMVQVHDWPVLSVGGGTSTVSEAAGESIPGGGAVLSPDAGGAGDAS